MSPIYVPYFPKEEGKAHHCRPHRGHPQLGDEGLEDQRDDGHPGGGLVQTQAQEQEGIETGNEAGRAEEEGRHRKAASGHGSGFFIASKPDIIRLLRALYRREGNTMPFIEIKGEKYHLDLEPEQCPICHFSVAPRTLIAVLSGNPDRDVGVNAYMDVAFQCVRRECGSIFIGLYASHGLLDEDDEIESFEFYKVLPSMFRMPDLAEEITRLSPNFAEIYGQAAAAEHYKLNQIAGVGYRKALEFLIKDYCITRHPDKAEKIKDAWLTNCIKTYVDDANTKLCAERAVWLGNDETHYVRRWEDKDIGDLKTLIRLTMAWIQNNLLTEKYLAEMP
jgi:hypothetical protein